MLGIKIADLVRSTHISLYDNIWQKDHTDDQNYQKILLGVRTPSHGRLVF